MTIQEKIDTYKEQRGFQEYLLTLIKEGYDRNAIMMAYRLVEQPFLTRHPERNEIILAIAKAKNLDFAYYAKEIIFEPELEENENLLEIVKTIANAENTFTPNFLTELSTIPDFWDSKNNIETFKSIVNSQISYSNFINLVDANILFREDSKILLDLMSKEPPVKENTMVNYLKSETLEINPEILKIISEYISLERIHSLNFNLYKYEQFHDIKIRPFILETLEHFKNKQEEAELFSCLELYDEETDPTIEREIGQVYGEVLSMSHDKQIKTLKKLKKQV